MISQQRFLGVSLAPQKNRRLVVAAFWVGLVGVNFLLMAVGKGHPQWNLRYWLPLILMIFGTPGAAALMWESLATLRKKRAGIHGLFETDTRDLEHMKQRMDEWQRQHWERSQSQAYRFIALIGGMAFMLHLCGLMPHQSF